MAHFAERFAEKTRQQTDLHIVSLLINAKLMPNVSRTQNRILKKL